jgi:hypothetical protein
MGSHLSRRTVAAGAAWWIPVIVVGSRAPALAASGCPAAVVGIARAQQGGVSVTLRLNPDLPYYCVASVTTTSSPYPVTSWTTGCFDQIERDADVVILVGTGDDVDAQNYRGDYIIDVVLSLNGNTCDVQAVAFSAT